MPLDPYHLTPDASINRVKLMSGAGLPEAWIGKTAYQVMGHMFLVQQIGEAFPEFVGQADPIPAFCDQYLAKKHPSAIVIAENMGLGLGCLLLTLKQGEVANREARPQWDESYWAWWGSRSKIILGGGLMASALGRYLFIKASAMLEELLTLEVAQYASALPLIGAARMVDESCEAAWAFDFGGTKLKRGKATYHDGLFLRLEQLPSLSIPTLTDAQSTFNFMVDSITDTLPARHTSNRPLDIKSSIANYANGCQLAPDTPYGHMMRLGGNLCELLADAIGQRIGYPVTIAFVHDGTAAAYAYAGEVDTAVITIGTALGIGFPPPINHLRPLSENFVLQNI